MINKQTTNNDSNNKQINKQHIITLMIHVLKNKQTMNSVITKQYKRLGKLKSEIRYDVSVMCHNEVSHNVMPS